MYYSANNCMPLPIPLWRSSKQLQVKKRWRPSTDGETESGGNSEKSTQVRGGLSSSSSQHPQHPTALTLEPSLSLFLSFSHLKLLPLAFTLVGGTSALSTKYNAIPAIPNLPLISLVSIYISNTYSKPEWPGGGEGGGGLSQLFPSPKQGNLLLVMVVAFDIQVSLTRVSSFISFFFCLYFSPRFFFLPFLCVYLSS